MTDEDIDFMMKMMDIEVEDDEDISFDEFLKMAECGVCGAELSELQMKQLFRPYQSPFQL